MRDLAERVLFSTTLEEKLSPGPLAATDDSPGSAIALPDAPGRPVELRLRADGVKADFPGTHRLDDDRERGIMLHFLANHELLAAELMALVLLRFPDAPKEYRLGVYEAMREEQAHALMYVRRMRECGIAFGELPVSHYFWRIVAPMETPLDFVTRLNLTFEQANLDFSKHYAGLFRQVGDTATAAVLEKIHLDEIGHVGHGVKWFRHWKQRGETDWEGFRRCLSFPLTPARAKGLAPFNAESRRLAGLDEDFIRHLEVCEASRGRTPLLHWFNPSAESHARSMAMGKRWQPDKVSLALEHDLEALMLACCRRDDAMLMRRPPSVGHLGRLKATGFDLPEIIPLSEVDQFSSGRKLSGLRPWAWSPDASEALRPWGAAIAPGMNHPWRSPLPAEWFSKAIGLQLESSLGPVPETGELLVDVAAIDAAISRHLDGETPSPTRQALLKAPFACSGRGHLRVNDNSLPTSTRGWITNTLAAHGAVVVEPWLDRVLDFSALYEAKADGTAELLGFTVMENDPAGRFQGIRVAPKFGTLLKPWVADSGSQPTRDDGDLALFLFREAKFLELYQKQLPPLLADLLPGYQGPLCIDAMVHRRADASLALKPIVELNVRFTMGRLAWEWMKRSGNRPSRLRLLRKAEMSLEEIRSLSTASGRILNDPEHAELFLAHWSSYPMEEVEVSCS
ncbi:uncharacterized ferritin-like protein (DUF455 family) [Haloferula luteola]|uniref:Uncharacterized ferritin-like protein (DUF455 family) n=1 Tax=Haloferula luteola TaxID=595692 RepID=A0A840V5F8_9BACT|nr:DUF455 family protein [Haloferula luteola]MBB5353477.1 uncharacterized ferritin-like protein (DUF455 family) [Haloferula luteola]